MAKHDNSPTRSGKLLLVLAAVVASAIRPAVAFAPPASGVRRSAALSMAPRFDKSSQKWYTNDPDEMAGSSYGPIGSLYRAGPKPFFSRIFDPEQYDQAS